MPNIVKTTTLPGPLDLLFPHSCRGCGRLGAVLCEDCKNYITTHREPFPADKYPNLTQIGKSATTGKPAKHTRLGDVPIYAVSKRGGLLGELIHDCKYHSIRAMARPLAELLGATLPATLPEGSVLVPLPTATHHIRSRGLDHTLLIARHLSRMRHVPVERVLIRAKNTVQVGSDRSARLSQADSAYAINPKAKIDPAKTYILLDDVWTTGASVLAAKKKLEENGADHIIISLLAYSS